MDGNPSSNIFVILEMAGKMLSSISQISPDLRTSTTMVDFQSFESFLSLIEALIRFFMGSVHECLFRKRESSPNMSFDLEYRTVLTLDLETSTVGVEVPTAPFIREPLSFVPRCPVVLLCCFPVNFF